MVLHVLPVSVAYAQGGGAGGAASFFSMILPFIILLLIFYFFLFRPQQKSAQRHEEMLKGLQRGDTVVTRGGLYGRIVNIKDDIVTLEVADNVRVRIEKQAVLKKKGQSS